MNDDIKAKVLRMDKLVEYQESSIVSKEVVSGETGNVTLFAFDKGEGLSEHTV